MTKRRVAEPTAEYAVKRKPTNLSLEAEAIRRGEAHARSQGVSLSALVNRLLTKLPDPRIEAGPNPEWSDAVKRWYHLGQSAPQEVYPTTEEAIADYHAYLDRKYGAR
jgi:hypothetical protein